MNLTDLGFHKVAAPFSAEAVAKMSEGLRVRKIKNAYRAAENYMKRMNARDPKLMRRGSSGKPASETLYERIKASRDALDKRDYAPRRGARRVANGIGEKAGSPGRRIQDTTSGTPTAERSLFFPVGKS